MIFLGGPASGKGTQTTMLAKKVSIPHIAAGDLLRAEIKSGSELGNKIKDIVEHGDMVADELVIEMVRNRLGLDDCKDGFILDGFPRDAEQAEKIEDLEIKHVINIKVRDDVLIERIAGRRMCSCGETYHLKYKPSKVEGVCDSCGKELYVRKDDDPEIIKERLMNYHKLTEPLIEFYGDKVINIDGERDISVIFDDICDKLGV